jgi:hypothetical protein
MKAYRSDGIFRLKKKQRPQQSRIEVMEQAEAN